MAVFPCCEKSLCFDPATPIQNLTAEASDGPSFLGIAFPIMDPNSPVCADASCSGGNTPPPTYFSGGCNTVCESQISQQDADLCAQRAAFICSHTPPPHNPPLPPPTFFFSNLQVCNLSCPDGTIFAYRVFPGAFVATTQAEADAQAAAFACQEGGRAMFCLSNIPNGCLNQPYAAAIQVGGGGGGSLRFFTSGSLPTDLVFTQTGVNTASISGSVTGLGSFNFSISVAENGSDFTFTSDGTLPPNLVFNQTNSNSALISGTVPGLGSFSFMVSVASIIPTTRSFTFSITAGTLPPGLSMTQTGFNSAVISGTPTTTGSTSFTVRATESNGNFMEKTYTIGIMGITNSPTTATQGTPYSFSFTVSGGTAPFTFFLASGSLPSGLSMDSSGNITGTPTTVATSDFTVSVSDSS